MKRKKQKSDGNLISFSVLLTPEGKIVSEISEFPVDKVDVVFSEMDRQIIRVLLQRAKRSLNHYMCTCNVKFRLCEKIDLTECSVLNGKHVSNALGIKRHKMR